MALTKCHECKATVSTEAKACPACGAPSKPRTGFVLKLFGVMFFSAVVLAAVSQIIVPVIASVRDDPLRGMKTKQVDAVYECEQRAVKYYKEIGSYPRLSDGRLASDVYVKQCKFNPDLFR